MKPDVNLCAVRLTVNRDNELEFSQALCTREIPNVDINRKSITKCVRDPPREIPNVDKTGWNHH